MLACPLVPFLPVLKTTKSLVQSGAPIGLNEYFAGYIPAPTVAPLPRLTLQSLCNLLFGRPHKGRPHPSGAVRRPGVDASWTARASSVRIRASTPAAPAWLARQAC